MKLNKFECATLSQLLVGLQSLCIKTDRKIIDEPNERQCNFCSTDSVEDEHH